MYKEYFLQAVKITKPDWETGVVLNQPECLSTQCASVSLINIMNVITLPNIK